MKNIILTIYILAALALYVQADTFHTNTNGSWTDNIWSFPDGTSTAGEMPAKTDSVIIKHKIDMNMDVTIHYTGRLIIEEGAELVSKKYSLEIKNGGGLTVYGYLEVFDLTFDNGPVILIPEGILVLVHNNFTNKNNSVYATINGTMEILGDYYNGQGSVIGGCGIISVKGYWNNRGIIFGKMGGEGNGPKDFVCSILPVELVDYKIKCTKTGSILEWTTATETENDFFTIEKSTDAKEWKIVTTIAGAVNSRVSLNYEYEDNLENDEITYYRVKQTDLDGEFVYFDMLSILCSFPNDKLEIIGINASSERLNLIVKTLGLDPLKISVVDMNGKVKVLDHSHNPVSGANIISMDQDYTPGIYIINIIQNQNVVSKKVYLN